MPLRYAFDTAVEADASGPVTAVRVRYEPGTVRGPVRAYYMVDTSPPSRSRTGAGRQVILCQVIRIT